MSKVKGLAVIVLVMFAFVFSYQLPTVYAAHGGSDVETEMAEGEEDTGSTGELASLTPDAEDEQMIEDSQHGE